MIKCYFFFFYSGCTSLSLPGQWFVVQRAGRSRIARPHLSGTPSANSPPDPIAVDVPTLKPWPLYLDLLRTTGTKITLIPINDCFIKLENKSPLTNLAFSANAKPVSKTGAPVWSENNGGAPSAKIQTCSPPKPNHYDLWLSTFSTQVPEVCSMLGPQTFQTHLLNYFTCFPSWNQFRFLLVNLLSFSAFQKKNVLERLFASMFACLRKFKPLNVPEWFSG